MTGMEIDVWIMRAALAAVIAACVGLFVRLRKVETGRAVADERIDKLQGRDGGVGAIADLRVQLDAARREVHEHRLCVAEHYVRRDDWVPTTSRVICLLEDHTRMLARLDERTRARGAQQKETGDGQ